MICVADVNAAGGNIRALDLRMTAQAKIGIIIEEQFLIDGTVGAMANRAAFPQGFMFKNKGPSLGLMTLGATLVLQGHRQPAGRLEDVAAMRIVAIHATHVAFNYRVMMRQIKFRLRIEVALEAGLRIFARVNDEFRRATGTDVFAARTVAGFATALARHRRVFKMQSGVRAGRKFPDDVRMTIGACMVADEMSAGNFQRCHHQGWSRRTRNQKKHHAG